MTDTTEKAISALCAADTSIREADAIRALAILRGDAAARHTPETKPMTRREVAELCGVSKQTVSNWGKEGVIRRCALAGHRKALGYVREDVYRILEGERKSA